MNEERFQIFSNQLYESLKFVWAANYRGTPETTHALLTTSIRVNGLRSVTLGASFKECAKRLGIRNTYKAFESYLKGE